MFKWEKLGRFYNPAETSDRLWMKEYAQSASVIKFENYIRVFFSCRSAADVKGQYISYLTYIDLNKNNLFEILKIAPNPILGLGELGTFDEFGTNPLSAIRDGREIFLYYCGWTRCESVPFNSAIGIAKSIDGGNNFTKIGKGGPVLSYTPEEPCLLGSPKIKKFNDIWYLFYAAGSKWITTDGKPEPIYKIKLATSYDGITWNKKGRDLIKTVLGDDECQASADVFFYQGIYHMFFSYRFSVGYRFDKRKGYRIGYASSKDLENWIRDDSKVGISTSNEGWDSEMISYSHVFELNNKLYMIYQGNSFGKTGLGLAILKNYQPAKNEMEKTRENI